MTPQYTNFLHFSRQYVLRTGSLSVMRVACLGLATPEEANLKFELRMTIAEKGVQYAELLYRTVFPDAGALLGRTDLPGRAQNMVGRLGQYGI